MSYRSFHPLTQSCPVRILQKMRDREVSDYSALQLCSEWTIETAMHFQLIQGIVCFNWGARNEQKKKKCREESAALTLLRRLQSYVLRLAETIRNYAISCFIASNNFHWFGQQILTALHVPPLIIQDLIQRMLTEVLTGTVSTRRTFHTCCYLFS